MRGADGDLFRELSEMIKRIVGGGGGQECNKESGCPKPISRGLRGKEKKREGNHLRHCTLILFLPCE